MESLTRELRKRQSPVRQFFEARFPKTRTVQQGFRDMSNEMIVPGNAANAGTVGTAADWLLRFLLHPRPDLSLAMAGAARDGSPFLVRAVADLARSMDVAVPSVGGVVTQVGDSVDDIADLMGGSRHVGAAADALTFHGPERSSQAEAQLLLRGCWALALLTELRRAGRQVCRQGPLGPYLPAERAYQSPQVSCEDLLGLASGQALDQLAAFRSVFETRLIPRLADRKGSWVLGPTFEGSSLLSADADFIAAGLLVELKTHVGDKRPDGSRRPSLDKPELFQLLGYALLDFDDQFGIREVGFFNARYGQLAYWPLEALMERLAEKPVSLAEARRAFEGLLRRHTESAVTPDGASAQ